MNVVDGFRCIAFAHQVCDVSLHVLPRPLGQLRFAETRNEMFFGGLTVGAIAKALGMSKRTVEADWAFSRAWLSRELAPLSIIDPVLRGRLPQSSSERLRRPVPLGRHRHQMGDWWPCVVLRIDDGPTLQDSGD